MSDSTGKKDMNGTMINAGDTLKFDTGRAYSRYIRSKVNKGEGNYYITIFGVESSLHNLSSEDMEVV